MLCSSACDQLAPGLYITWVTFQVRYQDYSPKLKLFVVARGFIPRIPLVCPFLYRAQYSLIFPNLLLKIARIFLLRLKYLLSTSFFSFFICFIILSNFSFFLSRACFFLSLIMLVIVLFLCACSSMMVLSIV